jgi:hypothetical protein
MNEPEIRSASVMRRIATQADLVSPCCSEFVIVGGSGSTHYYLCSKCMKACDPVKREGKP